MGTPPAGKMAIRVSHVGHSTIVCLDLANLSNCRPGFGRLRRELELCVAGEAKRICDDGHCLADDWDGLFREFEFFVLDQI